MRNLVTGTKNQNRWVVFIILITVLVFFICWFAISHNIHTVISHLFYIPVILACWRFPKQGILFTLGIVCGYGALEYFSHDHLIMDPEVILRCLIIIFIGLVVALLSQNLHIREENYRRLLSAIDTGVLVTDRSGTIQYANPYAVHVLDRKAASLNGASLYDFAGSGDDLNGFIEECIKNGHTDTTRELVLKRKDGYPVPVLLTGYFQKEENLIITLTDLSEEKWMAHELATGRMVMTTLMNAIPEGIFLSDTRGTIIEVNESCRSLTDGRRALLSHQIMAD
jgi:PAS domain S-box-containing protein